MFELADAYDGGDYDWPQVVGRKNEIGPLATAVPGAVAGLCAAHEQAGRLPLAQILEPAIEAADAGLEVAWNIVLAVVSRLDQIREIPSAASYLLDDGDPLTHDPYFRATRRLDTSALAATLRAIARTGPSAFHGGPAARAIEAEVARGGGILTAADLEAYRPKIMYESPATFRDVQYITANDQVGYEVLNILDQFRGGAGQRGVLPPDGRSVWPRLRRQRGVVRRSRPREQSADRPGEPGVRRDAIRGDPA